MKYRRISGAALLLSATMLLSACATSNGAAKSSATEQVSVQSAASATEQAGTSTTEQAGVQAAANLPDATPVDAAPAEIEVSDAFSTRDLSGTYDASAAVRITLGGASASCDSAAVTVSGATVTITAAGTYLLSGTLYNGTVIVDAGKDDKVQLVLDNASINSDTFAAIYVKQADKVFLTLPDGTVNTLTNGGTFTAIDDNNVDGVIFSKDDLTLNGTGKLVVTSPAKHGIVCKDDLVVTGGTYEITAASHAISAKDSFSVAGGTFTLTAGKDGVHVENDDAALGNVYIADGTWTVTADGDGVSASGTLRVDGGTFAVRTGGGRQNAKASDESRKGFKAGGNIAFNGGTVAIDAADDGISSDADITISGGNYAVAVGDDGIHADGLAQIDGGTLDINGAEGIEATYIRINDGTVNIYATDDGINSTRDSSAYSSAVEFNGGETTVEVGPGDTDGIDSNGALIITGGTVSVTGNSAFDYDGTLTFTGGTVIINGEQVDTIPNQMFGGGGRGGMGRGGTMPDGSFGGPRGNWSPDGNSGTEPDGSTTTPDGSTRRGGKWRPADGTTTSGDSVTPDARGGRIPGGQGGMTPNGRGGKSRTQTEVPDATTAPTQKMATI